MERLHKIVGVILNICFKVYLFLSNKVLHKVLFWVGVVALVCTLIASLFMGAEYFFKNFERKNQSWVVYEFKFKFHRFQSPIYWAKIEQPSLRPVIAYAQGEEALPVKEEEKAKVLSKEDKLEIIKRVAKHPNVVARIWMLESTEGTAQAGHHQYCNNMGESNEFGYNPFEKQCFADFEESVKAVDKLVSKLMENNSLRTVGCIYNTGRSIDTCEYANRIVEL